MAPDTPPAQNPWQSPHGTPQQPRYQPQYQPPPAYGAPPAGWQPAAQHGPPGKIRPTGRAILLFFVTLALYTYVYNYKVHKEMKEHSGRGVGGGVALLLTFVAGVAMPFVTSAEVGSLYSRRSEREPVRGWTGLWILLPMLVGYLLMFVGIAVTAATAPADGTGANAAIAVGFGLFAVVTLAGALVWFVKTNGALNRYWESLPRT